jgi:plasmid maintenance system killer protein
MDIIFGTRKLQKQFNEEKTMVKVHGPRRSRLIKVIMTQLHAAPNLGVFAPPYSPPNRCHELKGNKKNNLSIDLDGPHRLIFEPVTEPIPVRPEGGLDWFRVTGIQILGVENTHD